MGRFDDMPINHKIELYFEKHHALRNGDMAKLIEIKNKCPEIFDKNHDEWIGNLIEYFKKLQDTAYYKSLLRADMKNKLAIIKRDMDIT